MPVKTLVIFISFIVTTCLLPGYTYSYINNCYIFMIIVTVVDFVQSISHVQLFVTPQTISHQASLTFKAPW